MAKNKPTRKAKKLRKLLRKYASAAMLAKIAAEQTIIRRERRLARVLYRAFATTPRVADMTPAGYEWKYAKKVIQYRLKPIRRGKPQASVSEVKLDEAR